MAKNLLVLFIGILLFFPTTAQAAPEEIVSYQLSLAGYRLGMTYDEAVAVRPFLYMQNSEALLSRPEASIFEAFAENVYVDEIEMTVRISFVDDKISRIVARFSPEAMPEMLQRFQTALGPGKNKSKTFNRYDDEEIQHSVHLWDYPNAKMHMINISSVTKFATVSLITKKGSTAESTEEQQTP